MMNTHSTRTRHWRLLFALCATLLPAAQAKATDFASPNGYQVTIPDGWKVGQVPGTEATLYAPKRPDGTPNITLVTNGGVPPDATLEKVRDAVNRTHNHPDKDFKRVSQNIVTLNGERVLDTTVTYTVPDPLGKSWARQAIFIKNSNEYEFTCTASDAAHADYDSLFTAFLKTLRFVPPAADFTDAEIKRAYTDNPHVMFLTPQGWSVHPLPDKALQGVVVDTQADGNVTPNIMVYAGDVMPGVTLEQEQSNINTKNPAAFPSYVLHSQIVTTIDSHFALETCYTWGKDGKFVRGVQAYVVKNGTRFLVTSTVPETGHEKYDALVARFLQSLHFPD